MHLSIRTRFCHIVLYLHLFLLCHIGLVTCQYENTEEELVQPNRIDEVSSNFVCNSDGYFADVTYGCQFYHVCENANSPYDKPSFVKHTFSCVNGTVFNQMSFTCTRYQDSIPCESSPNYFYLNKRNGDPKAYFLTDEDIVKPSANGLKHSFTSNSLPVPYSPVSSSRPTASTITLRPTTTTTTTTSSSSRSSSSTASQYVTSSPVASNPRPVAVLQKSLHQPTESTVSYSPIGLNDYESNSLSVVSNSYRSSKASEPFQISPKYSSGGYNKIKPGVRYSSIKPHAKSKYEPSKKAFGYDSATATTSYISDIRPESSFLPRSEASGESSANVQYRSVISDFKPSSNSKIDQLLASFGSAESKQRTGKDTFGGYHRAAIESPKVVPISSITQPKRSTFTPAAFSKMYMENQKAAKYSHNVGNVITSTSSNDINSINSLPSRGDNRDSSTSSSSSYYTRPKVVESEAKTSIYSAFPSRATVPALPKESAPVQLSKYEAAPLEPSHNNLVKSNQYVVPSSIRIIEPPSTSKAVSSIVPLNTDSAVQSSSANEPAVKMSFVSKNANSQNSVTSDFGNLRVVKQVKGKNLLIDPSLENDPARDNIIAQVLEMLNKYN